MNNTRVVGRVVVIVGGEVIVERVMVVVVVREEGVLIIINVINRAMDRIRVARLVGVTVWIAVVRTCHQFLS